MSSAALSRRMWMARDLHDSANRDLAQIDGLRPVQPDDVDALAELMMDAYAGTIDFEEGATLEDARGEVRSGLGDGADLDPSVVIERDGRLVSTCLVTQREGYAALAFVMTHAAFTRQGLATAVMQHAMCRIHAGGERRVRLGVTRANVNAVRVYERLGFVDDGPVV